MKKAIGILILIAFILSACAQAAPSHLADIAAAEAIAKKYVEAYGSKNSDQFLALWSTDYEFMDDGLNEGPFNYSEAKSMTVIMFNTEVFQAKVSSTIVSADGRFISAQGMYTFNSKNGPPATVPFVSILEIGEGKIASETWYYNGTWF